jgi:Sulfatase
MNCKVFGPVVGRSRSRLEFDSASGRMVLAILAFLCWPVATLAFAQASGSRPNILLIFPDQLRAQALGCMGNPDVRTPNLDRLAAEGIVFRQTLANTPVCCPARANLLT